MTYGLFRRERGGAGDGRNGNQGGGGSLDDGGLRGDRHLQGGGGQGGNQGGGGVGGNQGGGGEGGNQGGGDAGTIGIQGEDGSLRGDRSLQGGGGEGRNGIQGEDGSLRGDGNLQGGGGEGGNEATIPPHVFKTTKKKSGKETLVLIVSGRYKFLKRKWVKNKFYFECNIPACSAKAHAQGQIGDKNPAITRIDTVHRIADGSGDIHLPDRGVRLAEECRERLRQVMYSDPTMACREVLNNEKFYENEKFY